ncbi:hypothetical protein [Prauserella sp. PE36]|uniref:hypothetical protein n=1 Tax=Prauserella sp. PE36 TaxID=1504709 RepID=UPI0011BE44E9|nr:hypothetical protein [Prauserella sp. PE36]
MLEKLQPGESESEVLAEACGATQNEAKANLNAEIADEGIQQQANYQLVHLYQHSYQGGRSTTIFGESACDSAGYGMSDLRNANSVVGGISSYRADPTCNGQTLYHEPNYVRQCGAHQTGTLKNVPWECNDHLFSMRVYRAYS